jgi:hypothetical protein
MTHDPSHPRRRALLVTAAALVLGRTAVGATRLATAQSGQGKPGDFDFLAGSWRIRHRRRKADTTWDEFDGEATCWTILAGTGSIEELRIPARDFSGMGIRLLDPKTNTWNDYWVNGKDRALGGEPGLTGAFVNGVGTFTASDTDDGKPIVVRGVWDRIAPTSHRWRQSVSRDGGTTWDDNWFMDWTRA